MRKLAVALAICLAACGQPGNEVAVDDPTPELMATALLQVVTVDHTFGQGQPSPFTDFLIRSNTDPDAGEGLAEGPEPPSRPLTDGERAAVETAVGELGPVTWLEEGEEWGPPEPSGDSYQVLLGVGVPVADEASWLVPVSMVCGNMCGTWLTYRIEMVEGEWAVTGIEGPVAIS